MKKFPHIIFFNLSYFEMELDSPDCSMVEILIADTIQIPPVV